MKRISLQRVKYIPASHKWPGGGFPSLVYTAQALDVVSKLLDLLCQTRSCIVQYSMGVAFDL